MIDRRHLISLVAAAGGMAVAPGQLRASTFAEASYGHGVVVDSLCFERAGFDARPLIAAGLSAVVLDLFRFPRNRETAFAELDAWANAFAAPASLFLPVLKARDFAEARRLGRLGVVLNSQDANILGLPTYSLSNENLATLQGLYAKGLRVLQLTYTDTNGIGSGYPEPRDGGLTRYGNAVVEEMNRLGMLIDTSHTGERTTLDAIGLSKRPIAITHAGCRALYDNPRNKSDELIRKLADAGGYFGVFNATLWMTQRPTASLEDVLDHIDHAVKVGGIDLVGFGSDQLALGDAQPQQVKAGNMSGFIKTVRGWPDEGPTRGYTTASELDHPDRCRVLADGLARRKYRPADIDKILGGNFVRVFAAACG